MKLVKEYAKTIAAFVAGVLGNLLVNLINGGTPWPTTSGEWVQLLVTTFGAAIATFAFPNKITQKQLDRDPNVVGGVVVDVPPPAAPPATGGWQTPWPK